MNAPAPFMLTSARLGALSLIDHFAARMGLRRLLAARVPADDARLGPDPAAVIAAVVANLATGRRPQVTADEPHDTFRPLELGTYKLQYIRSIDSSSKIT